MKVIILRFLNNIKNEKEKKHTILIDKTLITRISDFKNLLGQKS